MAYERYYPGICLERLKKTTQTSVRIASALAKIQIKHPLNTGLVLTTEQPFWCQLVKIKNMEYIAPWLQCSQQKLHEDDPSL
jgi:hypothetical protein